MMQVKHFLAYRQEKISLRQQGTFCSPLSRFPAGDSRGGRVPPTRGLLAPLVHPPPGPLVINILLGQFVSTLYLL